MKNFLRCNSFLLLAFVTAGCVANREKISFSDERQPPVHADSAPIPAPKPKLERQDLAKVEVQVFSYLLQRHLDDSGEYSAVFLEADEGVVQTLMKKFPKNNPPIKLMRHAKIRTGQSPLDLDTDRLAMVLSVNALDPESGMVEAIGRWFAGDAVTGFYTFELEKIGGDWVIQSVK